MTEESALEIAEEEVKCTPYTLALELFEAVDELPHHGVEYIPVWDGDKAYELRHKTPADDMTVGQLLVMLMSGPVYRLIEVREALRDRLIERESCQKAIREHAEELLIVQRLRLERMEAEAADARAEA